MSENNFNRTDFATQFTDFVAAMNEEAKEHKRDAVFLQKLKDHFRTNPITLPVISDYLHGYDHVNLQLALDQLIDDDELTTSLVGFQAEYAMGHASISALLPEHTRYFEGPVTYQTFAIGENEPVTAIQDGLLLLAGEQYRAALLLSGPSRFDPRLRIEIMSTEQSTSQALLSRILRNMRKLSAYRGKTLSVSIDDMRQVQIHVHDLPEVDRSNIILQEGVLDQIDRLTVRFAERAQELKQAGRHIKRGLLLYGPPGTGKTYTAMYLATAMKDRTIVMMTGRGMGSLESSVAIARTLAPAMVILEDVDLIGEERSQQNGCSTPLLFELLNQMDGLASDIDLIFLLTTNRPEILEPALAARPGRIDQAIEVPLPDASCRRRLLKLYGEGLRMNVLDMDSLIVRTEGASAAFIKELLRRAALYGDIIDGSIAINDKHLDEALQELLARGGQLTQSLLGFRSPA